MSILEFSGENRWLSNFWSAVVVLDGVEYPSVEHAYQAAKTVITGERLVFPQMTAAQAKYYGRKVTMRPDWNQIKLQIMEDLVRQKFAHKELRRRLLLTGDQEIVEGNTWGDIYWGVCRGKGQNHLGKIIMKIREEAKGGDEMKIVVFGSRSFTDYDMLKAVIQSTNAWKNRRITHVISGKAPGADSVGEKWANDNGVEVIPMPAAWRVMTPGCRVGVRRDGSEYNKDAGHIRNIEMADLADIALGFWDFSSPGTRQMINSCIERNIPLIVCNYKTRELYTVKNDQLVKFGKI